jgi:hypothetical protein
VNCSFSTIAGLISAAIALLVAAIAISYFWVAAVPLFIAAALVASVAYGLIPGIKNALAAYAQCRGESGKCSISLGINTLGQAAGTLSLISFLAAGVMEVAALAFLYSWFLAWLGVSIQVAVAYMVTSGQFSCAITVLILLGVLANAWAYKNCMDKQGSLPVGGSGTILQ